MHNVYGQTKRIQVLNTKRALRVVSSSPVCSIADHSCTVPANNSVNKKSLAFRRFISLNLESRNEV